ncbi:MAG: sigma 54-interacting transcriptional regulator [Planctomycetota bacterium]
MQPKDRRKLSELLKTPFGRRRDLVRRYEALLKLFEVGRAINSELHRRPLLERIMDTVIELTEAERGFLLLERDGDFHVEVARHFHREELAAEDRGFSRFVAGEVARTGLAMLTDNATDDDRFAGSASVVDLKLLSVLCVPLKVQSRLIGVITIDSRLQKGSFTDEDLALMEVFADQAAIALENARLYQENLEARESLEKLNARLQASLADREQELQETRAELERTLGASEGESGYFELVGKSPEMRAVYRLIEKVKHAKAPILIQGESGTGKELVARAIHYSGERRKHPFVSENCAAISESLLESELFGHVKGAFTGALADKRGLIERADGGTLFLDEIGEIDSNLQRKLLRVLQEQEVRRVGDESPIPVDVRIISATNRDLAQEVAAGRFREDLFYRLKVILIEVPPLGDRREDIPMLIEHFLGRLAHEMGRPRLEIAPEAVRQLCARDWPGNVRELENELTRLALLCEDLIGPELVSKPGPTAESETSTSLGDKTLEEIEREAICQALEATGGVKSEAARRLGLPRRTLYNKLKKFGLE